VLLCQFLVLAGNRFWFYLLCAYVLRVQYRYGVGLVFWFWWEIVFAVMVVLIVQYSGAVVSVLLLWWESSFCTSFLVESKFSSRTLEIFFLYIRIFFLLWYGSKTIQSRLFLKIFLVKSKLSITAYLFLVF
jgi:hypothetical protein